ncbi:casein kinase substrate phosphoprotein PP28-domain-containing protein [Triangularia setosa]|uniref:Casein kinase substrate phosphoprotein PP28-domain-containing protein n=1 Tax=Triangularia setosa TaxID=2587417 RepID=A0AAN6WAZ5_9PEZI|nr:casein kinase substrate phosphoprotein PP28-domain-containing protein [Podospora setosa]
MAGGGGAASSRGRGKFRKFTRGGGKHFSKNLRPLDADGNEVGMWGDAPEKDEEDEDSSEEESSEEESDDDDANPAKAAAAAAAAELSREERKKQKKAAKEAAIKAKKGPVQVGDMPSDSEESEEEEEVKMPANPNHSRAARNQTKVPKKVADDDDENLASETKKLAVSAPNKREREAIAAQEAKERYMKLHEAGKTDQAKADLARLKEIKRKREEEAARRLAEKQEQDEANRQKKAEIEAKEAKKREAALGPAAKNKKKK